MCRAGGGPDVLGERVVGAGDPDRGRDDRAGRHARPRARLPPAPGPAGQGLLLALVVDDLDAEFARIAGGGARLGTPPETEPWGERYCQFADANGIVWQLVQWVEAPGEEA